MKKYHDGALIAALALLALLIPEDCLALLALTVLSGILLFKLLKAAAAGGFFDNTNM